MFKNYFILNRLIIELNNELDGFSISNIFSQEKDKLVFRCTNRIDEKYLEICVNPGFPYITLKGNFNRAKKNTIDFFSEYLPLVISYFEIAGDDRTIRLKLETETLYYCIRGKYTNVTFQINNKLEHFKNPPDNFNKDNFITEQNATNFIKDYNIPKFQISEDKDVWTELKTKYPFIGKEILSEAKSRITEENKEEINSTLTEIIKNIFYEKPIVFLDEHNLQVHLGVASFNIFPFTRKIVFNDIISAYNFLLNKTLSFEQLNKKKKKIRKYLDKELSHFSSKMNKLKGVIERGSKEEEYQKTGNLLLINISSIHKGMKNIELEDIYNDNKSLFIKLDENLSPRKNIDKYFDKSKNDRLRLEKSKNLFNTASKKYVNLKKIEERFQSTEDPGEYYEIMKELNLKENRKKTHQDETQNKFRHYLIEKKYHVFVGRNNANNDLLTLKFARQNDYWFHARSVPGSHLILRVENTKEAIPKNILKKVASLAAFHSKAKTAGTVPVSYTLKKYVVKKKGMEPGKVALLREDTLLVKPGIPDKCEYVEKE